MNKRINYSLSRLYEQSLKQAVLTAVKRKRSDRLFLFHVQELLDSITVQPSSVGAIKYIISTKVTLLSLINVTLYIVLRPLVQGFDCVTN